MHVRRVALSGLAVLLAGAGPTGWVVFGPVARAHVVQMSTLPSGVEVHPVGEKVTGDGPGQLPINVAISPDGRTAVTSDSGPEKSLTVFDVPTRRVTQAIDMGTDALYYGLAWSSERQFLAGGGPSGRVYGVDRASNGTWIRSGFREAGVFVAGLGGTPDGDGLAVDQSSNALSITPQRQQARVLVPVGDHPQDVQVSKDGTKVYVSNWGARTISVILHPAPGVFVPAGAEANAAGTIGDTRDYLGPGNTTAGSVINVGDHPSELLLSPDGSRLYVTNGNDDTVSVIDTSTDRVVNTIDLAPYPGAPK